MHQILSHTRHGIYVFAIDLYLGGLWVFLVLVFFWWKIYPSLITGKRNFENRSLFGWSRAVRNDLPKIPCCNFADFELQKCLLENPVENCFQRGFLGFSWDEYAILLLFDGYLCMLINRIIIWGVHLAFLPMVRILSKLLSMRCLPSLKMLRSPRPRGLVGSGISKW